MTAANNRGFTPAQTNTITTKRNPILSKEAAMSVADIEHPKVQQEIIDEWQAIVNLLAKILEEYKKDKRPFLHSV